MSAAADGCGSDARRFGGQGETSATMCDARADAGSAAADGADAGYCVSQAWAGDGVFGSASECAFGMASGCSCVRRCKMEFRVDDAFAGAPVQAGGTAHLVCEGEVGHGGQGRVHCVRLEGDARPWALKTFARAEDARIEWDMLIAHGDDRTVPRPLMSGRLLGGGVSLDSATSAVGGLDALEPGSSTMPTSAEPAARPAFTPADARWGIVMEYVLGTRLADILADAGRRGVLTAEYALFIIAPIVRFVSNSWRSRHADAHRDIKPSNIIVEPGFGGRLVDFGIASGSDGGRDVRGTRFFTAPEVRFPERDLGNPDDARVDTYGIAATLHAMLSDDGCPPPYDGKPALPMPLRHDPFVLARCENAMKDQLSRRLAQRPDLRDVRAALAVAVLSSDSGIVRTIERGLDSRQATRLAPKEFEERLPRSPAEYEEKIIGEGMLVCTRMTLLKAESALSDKRGDASREDYARMREKLLHLDDPAYAEGVSRICREVAAHQEYWGMKRERLLAWAGLET